jgi:hypothetical protein
LKRFVLRYTGKGTPPAALAKQVQATPDLDLLEESGRMIFVEGAPEAVERLAAANPDWLLTEEATIPLPDPRKKVRKAPR